MGWRLKTQAKDWFGHLELDTMFTAFYFCLMVGLERRAHGAAPDGDIFLDYFPGQYKNSRYEIVGLLLEAELKRFKVDYSDEEDVQRQVTRLLDPNALSSLSNEGFEAANRYASGGFDLLFSEFTVPPRDLPTFMIRFVKLFQ